MPKISSEEWFPRVPEPYQRVQVNCCTNPDCENFLSYPYIPGPEEKRPRNKDSYRINSAQRGKMLQCTVCGIGSFIKSNRAVSDEINRLNDALNLPGKTFCTNPECKNIKQSFDDFPHLYKKNGFSRTGLQRLRCRICGRSVTVSDHRRESSRKWKYKDLGIFRALVNQVHNNAIARIEGMPIQAVYSAIDRIWRQCQLFAAHKERKLPKVLDGKVVNIAVDRQSYSCNWVSRFDRRTTVLQAVTSLDNISRFCFAQHLNFDDSLTNKELAKLVQECGDDERPHCHRLYARYWSLKDYQEAAAQAAKSRKKNVEFDLAENEVDSEQKLPNKGVQIHSGYTMQAHFYYLKELLVNTERTVFSMDREPGIARSFMTAFGDEVSAGKTHGFLVAFEKGMGQEARKGLVAVGNKVFREYLEARPDLAGMTDKEVKANYFMELISEARLSEDTSTNQIKNPFHSITEPYRATTCLSQASDPNDWLLANMHLNASLHSVDSFFNAVRRSISILERPISKAGNAGRVWAGKNPYNPEYIRKLLDIHRVYYNFIKPSAKSGKTPATSLGLTKNNVRFSDVLYFGATSPKG